jgi:rhodanese-related sulfurtransferase
MGILENLKDMLGITSVDYKKLVTNGAMVVDVRSPEEFKSGNVKNSKNFPLGTFSNHLNKMEGKTVVLVCRSGGRASSAKSILTQNGIESHNAGAWQNLK